MLSAISKMTVKPKKYTKLLPRIDKEARTEVLFVETSCWSGLSKQTQTILKNSNLNRSWTWSKITDNLFISRKIWNESTWCAMNTNQLCFLVLWGRVQLLVYIARSKHLFRKNWGWRTWEFLLCVSVYLIFYTYGAEHLFKGHEGRDCICSNKSSSKE